MKHGNLFSRGLGFVARHLGSRMRLRARRFVVGRRTNYRHFVDIDHGRMSADYAALSARIMRIAKRRRR